MYADGNVIQIKHDVLYEVARLAFAGELEEKREEIAYELVPGPIPQFLCCIYREREVIRQRVLLAEGSTLPGNAEQNVIQVIRSACEGCPISSYTVTENCQKCSGKACINACKFDAIEAGRTRSHIDPLKCKECGKCAEACPYNAIAHLVRPCKNSCPVNAITYNEYGISVIDEKKCIRCGKCIHSCPFGAIGSKTFIVDVIRALQSGKRVYAMAAPSTEGQFGERITMNSWRKAMKAVGFYDFVEVGLGGDMTAAYEAEEWAQAYQEGRKKVTSCCPGFVNMVYNQFPELKDHVSATVSPMCAVSRMIKAKDPEAVTVFIGPCIAKKSEIVDQQIEGNADYALTYSEIRAIMRAKGAVLEEDETFDQKDGADVKAADVEVAMAADIEDVCENREAAYQQASRYGKHFGNSGGVTAAVRQSLKELAEPIDVKICVADGAEECRKALLLLKAGKLTEDFVEGMTCKGGCVGGPSAFRDQAASAKDRKKLLEKADERGIHENLKEYPMDSFLMYRE